MILTPKLNSTSNCRIHNPTCGSPPHDTPHLHTDLGETTDPSLQSHLRIAYRQNAARFDETASPGPPTKAVQGIAVWYSVRSPLHSFTASSNSISSRSNQDIANQAVVEVSDKMLYDVDKGRRPTQHGALDSKLVRLYGGFCDVRVYADALFV